MFTGGEKTKGVGPAQHRDGVKFGEQFPKPSKAGGEKKESPDLKKAAENLAKITPKGAERGGVFSRGDSRIPVYTSSKAEYDQRELFIRLQGPGLTEVDLPVSFKKKGPFTQEVRVNVWESGERVKATYVVYMSPGAEATHAAATSGLRQLSTRVTSWK